MKPLRLRLIDDWRAVLRRAWSIRLLILAGLLSGLEVVLEFADLSSPVLPALTGIVTAAAFVARLVAQKDVAS